MNRTSYLFIVLILALSGCASLPENTNRTESHAFSDTQDTLLSKNVQAYREQGKNNDGFILLGSGLDAFVARAVLAETAERSLDVQYYLYHNELHYRLWLQQQRLDQQKQYRQLKALLDKKYHFVKRLCTMYLL